MWWTLRRCTARKKAKPIRSLHRGHVTNQLTVLRSCDQSAHCIEVMWSISSLHWGHVTNQLTALRSCDQSAHSKSIYVAHYKGLNIIWYDMYTWYVFLCLEFNFLMNEPNAYDWEIQYSNSFHPLLDILKKMFKWW